MSHSTAPHAHEPNERLHHGHEPHDHSDAPAHDQPHEQGGFWSELKHFFQPHSHTHHTVALDPALANERGIWALKVSLAGLMATAIFQVAIVAISGSVALLVDGLHACTDGFTSLGVLAGAMGVWLGFPWADPLVGLLISLAILVIVWNTAHDMWRRMMDAIEPDVIDRIEKIAHGVEGVIDVHDVIALWLSHRQRSELHFTVNCQLPTVASHYIGKEVRHALFHELPALANVTVHIDLCECDENVKYHPATHHT